MVTQLKFNQLNYSSMEEGKKGVFIVNVTHVNQTNDVLLNLQAF